MKYPKPFYRSSRDCWMVQIGTKQIVLAKGRDNEALAWKEYHRVMAAQGKETPKEGMTVELAVDIFLDPERPNFNEASRSKYQEGLQSFVDSYGNRKVSSITDDDIRRWAKRKSWGPSTANTYLAVLSTWLKWCVKRKIVAVDPSVDVKRPKMKLRERTLTAEERKAIREALESPLAEYVDALTWTGCRPSDVSRLEAKHINFATGFAKLPGKTTEVTGDLVELTLIPPMLEMCRRLAKVYPEGPLFRPSADATWTKGVARMRLGRVTARLKIKGVSPYTYRHSFATDALERGVDVAVLSVLMNHKSIATTMRYVHLRNRKRKIHEEAQRAAGFTSDDTDERS